MTTKYDAMTMFHDLHGNRDLEDVVKDVEAEFTRMNATETRAWMEALVDAVVSTEPESPPPAGPWRTAFARQESPMDQAEDGSLMSGYLVELLAAHQDGPPKVVRGLDTPERTIVATSVARELAALGVTNLEVTIVDVIQRGGDVSDREDALNELVTFLLPELLAAAAGTTQQSRTQHRMRAVNLMLSREPWFHARCAEMQG